MEDCQKPNYKLNNVTLKIFIFNIFRNLSKFYNKKIQKFDSR